MTQKKHKEPTDSHPPMGMLIHILLNLKKVYNRVQCSHKQLTSEYGSDVSFNILRQKYRKNIGLGGL